VVVATGPFQLPQIPAFAAAMPVGLFQVHSRDYRNPSQLPDGAVLIVGSGASGCQIAEELHQAGRKVYLSTGRFHKTPRRYRGRDIYWWFEVLGIWHRPLVLQPEVRNLRFVVPGAGGGHDIDLRRFAADGMTLLGKLRGVVDEKLVIEADLENTWVRLQAVDDCGGDVARGLVLLFGIHRPDCYGPARANFRHHYIAEGGDGHAARWRLSALGQERTPPVT
jgi:putative flavoprotein involved in K+ transport